MSSTSKDFIIEDWFCADFPSRTFPLYKLMAALTDPKVSSMEFLSFPIQLLDNLHQQRTPTLDEALAMQYNKERVTSEHVLPGNS